MLLKKTQLLSYQHWNLEILKSILLLVLVLLLLVLLVLVLPLLLLDEYLGLKLKKY